MHRIITLFAIVGCIAWLFWPGAEPYVVLVLAIGALYRDEIHGIISGRSISLNPRRDIIKSLTPLKYSFTEKEFINPLIVADLNGWISDTSDQITSIDVLGSNDSNRYSAQVNELQGDQYPTVEARQGNGECFSYEYIGCSPSGLHILLTKEYGAGTAVFCSLLFVTLSIDYSIELQFEKLSRSERLVMKKVGSMSLGYRYGGEISYSTCILKIGKSTNTTCTTPQKRVLLW